MKIWKNTSTLDDYVPELKTADYALDEAELAVVGAKKFNVKDMPSLKAVFKCGIGTDNIDFDGCYKRGIHVVLPRERTANIIYDETANFAFYLILERLFANVGNLESWTKQERPSLRHRVVLLLGQGNIGRRVKTKLEAFVTVHGFDTATDNLSQLEPLMRKADVVSLHIPLTENTRGWIDAEKLSWMKDGAALINTARGAIVDEDSLYKELSSGRLTASFDVFWQEPYRGKLTGLPANIFHMSPHIASNCTDFLQSLSQDLQELIDKMKND